MWPVSESPSCLGLRFHHAAPPFIRRWWWPELLPSLGCLLPVTTPRTGACGCLFANPLSRLGDLEPEMGLLERTIILVLVFGGAALSVSPFYIPASGAQRFQFLRVLHNLFSAVFYMCSRHPRTREACFVFMRVRWLPSAVTTHLRSALSCRASGALALGSSSARQSGSGRSCRRARGLVASPLLGRTPPPSSPPRRRPGERKRQQSIGACGGTQALFALSGPSVPGEPRPVSPDSSREWPGGSGLARPTREPRPAPRAPGPARGPAWHWRARPAG